MSWIGSAGRSSARCGALPARSGTWSACLGDGKAAGAESPATAKLADLQDEVRAAAERDRAIQAELAAVEAERIDEGDLAAAVAGFDPVWEALSPREQARVVQLLVERVAYDGAKETVAVTFRPAGIKVLAGEAP